jgi:DNA-binding CsgD family transcriptional regulator
MSSPSGVASSKRGVQSGPQNPRSGLLPSSDPTTSFEELTATARRCRTPKQFRKLLERLRSFIPYQKFAGSWGYPSRITIRFLFNQGVPLDAVRWYLATGSNWTNPVFQEWLQTNRTVLWCDAAKRLKVQEKYPELVRRFEQAGLQYTLVGGVASPDYYVHLAAAMASEELGRVYLSRFESIVPWLVEASQRAYPHSLLTKREAAVLERRALGEITKKIAAAEGISERTVTMHLQRIKTKLYTDDLVNAVAIAVKSGMVLHP